MKAEVITEDGFHSVRLYLEHKWNAIRVFDAASEADAMERGLPILLDWARAA